MKFFENIIELAAPKSWQTKRKNTVKNKGTHCAASVVIKYINIVVISDESNLLLLRSLVSSSV